MEKHAFSGHLVDVWCAEPRLVWLVGFFALVLPKDTDVTISKIIAEDEEDVWLLLSYQGC